MTGCPYDVVISARDGQTAALDTFVITINPLPVNGDSPLPLNFSLQPPNPNPFNSATTIRYSLPAAGRVSLAVYDLQGRLVEKLVEGIIPAGRHEVCWNAESNPAGIYFLGLTSGEFMDSRKVLLMR